MGARIHRYALVPAMALLTIYTSFWIGAALLAPLVMNGWLQTAFDSLHQPIIAVIVAGPAFLAGLVFRWALRVLGLEREGR